MSGGAAEFPDSEKGKPIFKLLMYLALVVLLGNLNAMIHELLYPESRYLLVGEITALVVVAMLGALEVYLARSRRAETEYRMILATAMDGFWITDHEGRLIDVNDAACRHLGYSREEFLRGMRLRDIEAVESPEETAARTRKIREEGKDRFESRHRRKDGTLVETEVSVHYTDTGGGRYFTFIRDITERKKAEEALQETTRTLEELVEASPVGIFVLDPEGRVLLWNPAMERIFGWTDEEVRGKLVPTVAAGQKGARETLERFLAGERLAGVELRRFRKNGQPVDLLLWTAPLREDSGRFKSTVVILLDVTHLKEVERIALAQQKLASLGQVAAGIAHEIRNPLSGINLYLHSLETFLSEAEISDPEIRERTEAAITSMQAASTKMESVIQRVLAFSQPGPARMEPIDVNACIQDAVDMARIALQKAGARVAVALRDDLPACRGDRQLLAQALINLLSNAAQSMEGQEQEKHIEVLSGIRGGHVTISVADAGLGVPEEIREKIFDPFFTTKASGTGIGLSITQKIVSDHGGFIGVGKSRWGGALFTIGLPAGDTGGNPGDRPFDERKRTSNLPEP